MIFASREDAGRKLGQYLQGEGIEADLVVGLPRGGVVVAAEVALVLQLPLDVLIVRKIGHPWHREFAVGALAENDVVVMDESARGGNWLVRGELRDIIQEEQERLRDYGTRFHPEGGIDLAGKRVLIVDDGLATGATTEAAVIAARKQKASRITVAVPVTSTHALHRVQRVADDVRALIVDPDFEAVGRYYETFTQTTDEQVVDLLKGQGKVTRDA
jgi:putative phosphoribosyl transferase